MTDRSNDLQSVACSSDRLADLLALVSQIILARWPRMTLTMRGNIAWELAEADAESDVRLWYVNDEPVAYGWFQPNTSLEYDIREGVAGSDAIAAEILAWATQKRLECPPGALKYLNHRSMEEWAEAIRNPPPPDPNPARTLVVRALESDSGREEFLARSGFDVTQHFEPWYAHDLVVPEPNLPEGVTVHAVREHEFEEYVATHRDAWAPSSGFSLERYARVRAMTELFDPDLNLVAEVSPGRFGACTIFWADPVSRVGMIEPFGTRPDARGRGISQALIHEGLRRLGKRGMAACRVGTAGFNHPAQRLYQSCGFREVDRSRTWAKQL